MNSLDKDIKLAECQISDIDIQIQSPSLSIDNAYRLLSIRRSISNRYSALLRQDNIHWGQRARLLQVLNGDLNTIFFILILVLTGIKTPSSKLLTSMGLSRLVGRVLNRLSLIFIALSGLNLILPCSLIQSRLSRLTFLSFLWRISIFLLRRSPKVKSIEPLCL